MKAKADLWRTWWCVSKPKRIFFWELGLRKLSCFFISSFCSTENKGWIQCYFRRYFGRSASASLSCWGTSQYEYTIFWTLFVKVWHVVPQLVEGFGSRYDSSGIFVTYFLFFWKIHESLEWLPTPTFIFQIFIMVDVSLLTVSSRAMTNLLSTWCETRDGKETLLNISPIPNCLLRNSEWNCIWI